MDSSFWVIVTLIIISLAVIAFAFIVARAVQRAIDRFQEDLKRNPEKAKQRGWKHYSLNLLTHSWAYMPAAIASIKFVYREWKTAPSGSPEQLGWGMILAAIVAVPLWFFIWLADKIINRSHLGYNKNRETLNDLTGENLRLTK